MEPQTKEASQGGNAILPTRAPVSFKRLLGGCRRKDLDDFIHPRLELGEREGLVEVR